MDLRDRSCRLRCSLRLNARLQYWHLYFFSGAEATFLGVFVVAAAALPDSAVAASDWAMADNNIVLEVLRPGASLSLESELVQRC